MFFWWICGGESVLPVLLVRHLPPFPISSFQSWITLYDLSLRTLWYIHLFHCTLTSHYNARSKQAGFHLFCSLSYFQTYANICAVFSFSVWLFAIVWTEARWALLSMGFFWQVYWSGLPFPSPGELSTQGSNPCLSCLLHCRQILYHWATGEAMQKYVHLQI